MTEVIEILKQCTVLPGNIVMLPPSQLDRKLYTEVAAKLAGIGGKWNKKANGFVFPHDPTDLLAEIAGGGSRNLKKEFQFFPTPAAVADRMADALIVYPGALVLEPSAGQGALIEAVRRQQTNCTFHAYEINPLNWPALQAYQGVAIIGLDFLQANPDLQAYDYIIANPPFSGNQDIDHFRKMWSLLTPGGRIVSAMSKHWQISQNRKEREFMAFLDEIEASIQNIDAGAFKASGTMTSTCYVVADKPRK